MPEERFDLRNVEFREIFPWLHLFRGFGIAGNAHSIVLGAAGALLTAVGWWAITSLVQGDLPTEPSPPELSAEATDEERTLADEECRPDAEWAARLTSGADSRHDLPLVAESGAEPVGLAWGRIEPSDPQMAYLYQVWVAPSRRGLGTGRTLVDAVVAWAPATDARNLTLGDACGDTRATRLYTRAGFRPGGEPTPEPVST